MPKKTLAERADEIRATLPSHARLKAIRASAEALIRLTREQQATRARLESAARDEAALAAVARTAFAKEKGVVRVPPENRTARDALARFKQDTAGQVEQWRADVAGHLAAFREANVLAAPAEHQPRDAADAMRIMGITSTFAELSPEIAVRTVRQAIARNDLALVARLGPMLESWSTYRKHFEMNSEVTRALDEVREATTTDDALLSQVASEHAEKLERVVELVANTIAKHGAVDPVFEQTGALAPLIAVPDAERAA